MEQLLDEYYITPSGEDYPGLDIAFVIDTTGSMDPYIKEAKQSIKNIIEFNEDFLRQAFPKEYKELIKIGVVAYRDHPPQDTSYVTKLLNFSKSEEALEWVSKLKAGGGGDAPEATLDGLNKAVFELNWREESDKMLFLILDSPGHGKRFGTPYDCPCNIKEEDFLPTMAVKGIRFFIIRKSPYIEIDKMIECFKTYIEMEVLVFDGTGKVNSNLAELTPLATPTPDGETPDGFKNQGITEFIIENVKKSVRSKVDK